MAKRKKPPGRAYSRLTRHERNECVLSTGFEQKSHLDLSSSVTDVSMENRAGQACCMSALRTRYDSPRNLRSRPWCTTRSITAAAI